MTETRESKLVPVVSAEDKASRVLHKIGRELSGLARNCGALPGVAGEKRAGASAPPSPASPGGV